MAKAQFGRGGQMPSPQANFAPQNIGPIARTIPQPGRPGPYNGPSIVRPQKGGGLQARGNAMPSASNALSRFNSMLNRTHGSVSPYEAQSQLGVAGSKGGAFADAQANAQAQRAQLGSLQGPTSGAFPAQANAAQDLYAQKRAAMGLPPRVTPPPTSGGYDPRLQLGGGPVSRPAAAQQQLAAALQRFRSPIIR